MKLLLKFVLFLSITIITLVLLFKFWLNTDYSRITIGNFINNYIEKNIGTNYNIELSKINFSLPLVFETKNLTLRENNSEVISVKNCRITLEPIMLMRGIVLISLSFPKLSLYKLPDELEASASIKYSKATNAINISNVIIKYQDTAITGSADYQQNSLISQLNYKGPIPKNILPNQTSFFDGTVHLKGPISNLAITSEGNGNINSENKDYFQLPKIKWNISLISNGDNLKGNMIINTNLLNIVSDISKNNNKFYIQSFKANGSNLRSSGNLMFDNKTKNITSEFMVNSTNISNLKEFFPFLNRGNVDIKTNYKTISDKKQGLTFIAKGKNLSTNFGDCNLIDINFAANNLVRLEIDHVDIVLKSLAIDKTFIRDFSFKAINKQDVISFDSSIKALEPYNINLKTSGAITKQMHLGDNLVSLTTKGNIAKLKLNTPEPITIRIGKTTKLLADNISVSNGKLNANLMFDHTNITGKFNIINTPVMIASGILPEAFIKSLISGDIDVAGTITSPIIRSKLQISNIELIKKTEDFSTINIISNYSNNNLSIESDIIKQKTSLANINFNLPCHISLSPFLFNLSKDQPMKSVIHLKKHDNFLALIPLPPGHKLIGYAIGDVNITGTYNSPNINGIITIDKTEYKQKGYGVKLKAISSKITSQNNNVSIKNFIAHDPYSNILEGTGTLSIKNNLPFNINLHTKKFNFLSTPYLQGEISGKILISGNNQEALAKGNFMIGPMEIKIPEHFSDEIPELNVQTSSFNKESTIINNSYIFNLDIDFTTGAKVFARGWGVDTLLNGSLKITNNLTNPYIFGTLKSVHGKYKEFGKVLEVKEGVLNFNGPISPSPYLNIVGTTKVSGDEISLILSGSIFSPDVRIESSDSGTGEQAVSKLLFGQTTEKISPVQAIALADAMRKISKHGGGFDPMSFGKKILGVDEIAIKNNEDSDSIAIGIGKYITDKVYVEVEQGNQVTDTKTKIQVELSPKISIEGITGVKGNSSFGINWRFDY